MATHTTYYNLTKPSANDKVNIGVLNDNADVIDTALHNKVNNEDTQNITTSANKCMMSDGVTSAEDALDGLTENIDEMLTVESFTATVTASTTAAITTKSIAKTGYVPLICSELQIAVGSGIIEWAYVYASGNTATIHYKGASSGTVTFNFKVLYKKKTTP